MWCRKYNSDKNVVLISCLVDAAVLKYTIYTPISGVCENKEKRDTFPVSKKNKTLDHGFGLCVCTTSKRVEKCRQLGAKPPH